MIIDDSFNKHLGKFSGIVRRYYVVRKDGEIKMSNFCYTPKEACVFCFETCENVEYKCIGIKPLDKESRKFKRLVSEKDGWFTL